MRADFYLIAKPRFREQPLRLVCELARKAHDANLWTLVLARDAAQAAALDDMLWDMGDDVFIPHQIAREDDDEDEAAVLIAPPEVNAPLRPLVINLRDESVEGSFERVVEPDPDDDVLRGPISTPWKQTIASVADANKPYT